MHNPSEITQAEIKPETELRKVTGRFINGLIQILEPYKDWEKLMSEIRHDPFNLKDKKYKYTNNDIKTIAAASIQYQRPCTEIFFEEWGTSGRKRPTVQLLYDYLKSIGLWRAADYIGTNFLKISEIKELQSGPSTEIDLDDITLKVLEPVDRSKNIYDSQHHHSTVKCGEYVLSNIQEHGEIISRTCTNVGVERSAAQRHLINSTILSQIEHQVDRDIKRIPCQVLRAATENFNEKLQLGKGAFGSVYLGKLDNTNRAIKVLEDCALEHFQRELIILSSNIQHAKLLYPIAVSVDEIPCLVYPYMPHGSLEERLALKIKELSPLSWMKRVSISGDIIEGLRYLHTRSQPIVHRDIKTSNILLDSTDVAKIGDFGLIREKKEMVMSIITTVQGTDAYMAPEAYRFQSSTKLDVYSYGMVLLEMLTGLPIIDEEKGHLRDYVEEVLGDENNDILKLLDEKAGKWDHEIANELYVIANNCLELETKRRYDSADVENKLKHLIAKLNPLE